CPRQRPSDPSSVGPLLHEEHASLRHCSFTASEARTRAQGDERKTVLIVDEDGPDRDRMGRWFERAGYEVLACPGPTTPDLTCLGGRGGPCPLVEGADLVVLDLWLQSDTLADGTSSLELLMYY